MIDVKVARVSIDSCGYEAKDVTEAVRKLVRDLGLVKGVLTVYSLDGGCFVLGIEYEPSLLADLEDFMKGLGCLERYQPCVALFSKPLSIAVVGGELQLGVFRRVVFIDVSRVRGEKRVVVVAEGVFEKGSG